MGIDVRREMIGVWVEMLFSLGSEIDGTDDNGLSGMQQPEDWLDLEGAEEVHLSSPLLKRWQTTGAMERPQTETVAEGPWLRSAAVTSNTTPARIWPRRSTLTDGLARICGGNSKRRTRTP